MVIATEDKIFFGKVGDHPVFDIEQTTGAMSTSCFIENPKKLIHEPISLGLGLI